MKPITISTGSDPVEVIRESRVLVIVQYDPVRNKIFYRDTEYAPLSTVKELVEAIINLRNSDMDPDSIDRVEKALAPFEEAMKG